MAANGATKGFDGSPEAGAFATVDKVIELTGVTSPIGNGAKPAKERRTDYHHAYDARSPHPAQDQERQLRGLGSLGSADVPDLDDRNRPAGELQLGPYFLHVAYSIGKSSGTLLINVV
jgi:hypothetical protein